MIKGKTDMDFIKIKRFLMLNMWGDMLITLTVVINSQCKCISNRTP